MAWAVLCRQDCQSESVTVLVCSACYPPELSFSLTHESDDACGSILSCTAGWHCKDKGLGSGYRMALSAPSHDSCQTSMSGATSRSCCHPPYAQAAVYRHCHMHCRAAQEASHHVMAAETGSLHIPGKNAMLCMLERGPMCSTKSCRTHLMLINSSGCMFAQNFS